MCRLQLFLLKFADLHRLALLALKMTKDEHPKFSIPPHTPTHPRPLTAHLCVKHPLCDTCVDTSVGTDWWKFKAAAMKFLDRVARVAASAGNISSLYGDHHAPAVRCCPGTNCQAPYGRGSEPCRRDLAFGSAPTDTCTRCNMVVKGVTA